MARRQKAQKEAKARGDSLERRLDEVHAFLRARRLAKVHKIPTNVRITSSKGRTVKGRKLASEWTDYAGTLGGEYRGRSVVFEAKASGPNDDRFSFGRLESDGTGEDQIEILSEHAAFGAVTFVFVRKFRDSFRYTDFVFPVRVDGSVAGVPNQKGVRGTRSLRYDEAEAFAIARAESWYDALERLA